MWFPTRHRPVWFVTLLVLAGTTALPALSLEYYGFDPSQATVVTMTTPPGAATA